MAEKKDLMCTPWCESYLNRKIDLQTAADNGWVSPDMAEEFPLASKLDGEKLFVKKFAPSFQCGSHAIFFWLVFEIDQAGRVKNFSYLPVQKFEAGRTTCKPMELYPTDEELYSRELDSFLSVG